MQLIFNRKELKFIVNRTTFEMLMSELPLHTKLDKYNIGGKSYPIYSIYFDTADGELARMSFDKERYYRYKVRLRSYCNFQKQKQNQEVFLEIKKKVDGFSNKRRIRLSYADALKFIEDGVMPKPDPHTNKQVVREMSQYFAKHKLRPTTHVTYQRYAFTGENDLRITLDTNIETINYAEDHLQNLLEDGQYVLEIKATGSIPLWLAHLLSENKIYGRSFSKYGQSHINKLKKELQYV